jgi:ATP-dependent helicase/nuclease subunit A
VAELLPFPTPIDSESAAAFQPPDAEARQQALNIGRSFIVEAPAGSGKTGLLIQRFLKLLADDSVTTPEQVLAITFTIKATAEMRDRVLAHLEAARSDFAAPLSSTASDFDRQTRALALAVLERDHQLGWSLLEQPGRLNIRTIDSVCAEIARSLPILSGSGGHLTPAQDANPLHREAARRTLLLLGSGDPVFDAALRNLLLHRDGNLADCETLIADMLSLRDQWGELIWGDLIPIGERPSLDDAYLDEHVLPRLQKTLDHAIGSALKQLEQAFPPDVLTSVTTLASELGDLDGYKGKDSPIAICSGQNEPPDAIAAHLDHWLALIHLLVTPSGGTWRKGFSSNHVGFKSEKYQKAQLKAVVDQISHRDDLLEALCRISALPSAIYPDAQWQVAKSLFRVLSHALVELQLVFAKRDECDFTELSLLARHALTQGSGAEDFAEALGARLQHLLVDEMQDTSAGQYDLLELLTRSWDGYSQTVFLVGDPRQSIYLFRQARVERFIQAMSTQRLGDLPLTGLQLTANFRSQSNLVDQFNIDFRNIFPESSSAGALPYSDAEAILPPSPDAAGVKWHTDPLPYVERQDAASSPSLSATPTSKQLQRKQRSEHAHEILRIAQHWFAKPLPANRKAIRDEHGNEIPEPWRIAVLVRSRNHLSEIVAALREQDQPNRIPFRAIDIDSLNERQEILDLTALTRALFHPADRVATLSILRAPWCGLSLADLHLLTGSDDPELRNHSIQRLMDQRGHLLSEESCQRLTRVWTVLQAATAQRARFTATQLVERAWRSLGGDVWLSEPQLINARRFFQLLDALEDSGVHIDSNQLEQRLQSLYAEPEPVPAGTPYLELLTIHKAKGLEWDVVVVPAIESDPGSSSPRLLTWSVLDDPDDSLPTEDQAGDVPAHIMLAPIAAKGEDFDVLTTWLNGLQRAREAAENKRLFYVACTRARQELHLFAAPSTKVNGEISVRSRSLLKAAWAAAEPHFTQDSDRHAEVDLAAAGGSPEELATAPIRFRDNELRNSVHVVVEPKSNPKHPILHRLPLTFDPAARFTVARTQKLPYGEPDNARDSSDAQFSRPEGSFAARSFGNAVHASLELLARRIAAGETPAQLLAELPAWTPRIAALLRADGLPGSTIERYVREALNALNNVLRDTDGLWLLSPHPGAASEFALTSWTAPTQVAGPSVLSLSSVRADRIFHAGSEPRASGDNSLWIIDYKTTHHGPAGLEEFLNEQRAAYAPQLETYARILAPAQSKSPDEVRLALYFPTLPRLIWWKAPGH